MKDQQTKPRRKARQPEPELFHAAPPTGIDRWKQDRQALKVWLERMTAAAIAGNTKTIRGLLQSAPAMDKSDQQEVDRELEQRLTPRQFAFIQGIQSATPATPQNTPPPSPWTLTRTQTNELRLKLPISKLQEAFAKYRETKDPSCLGFVFDAIAETGICTPAQADDESWNAMIDILDRIYRGWRGRENPVIRSA